MRRSALAASAVALALAGASFGAAAQTAAKPAARPAAAAKRVAKAPPPPPEPVVEDATPEQVKAADLVFYGRHDCEFDQSLTITQSPKHSAYVELRSGKSMWLMKPVLSSTGAIRLEDVRGQTLLVQIAAKSMLLDVKAGKRLNDECVCDKQRELVAEAKAATAAAEAVAVKAREEAARAAAPAAPTAPVAPAAPAAK
jgi:hypothetical protein